MDEVKKSDFIYFQNEFLQDIKKLDIKFNEKISQIMTTFQNNKLITDQKFQIYNDKISSLRTTIESNEEFKKVKTELENFKKK
jgi:low affinity Fe/Cu permease